MHLLRLSLSIITALFLWSSSYAQTTGTLLGKVTDPNGAVIPAANVVVENLGTAFTRNANTNTDGQYLIPQLPTGIYKVTVEHAGFQRFIQTGVEIQIEQNARLDITLSVGQVTETVSVSGDASRVDTQSSTVGTSVDRQRLVDLPLNGRNALELTQLLPGVGTSELPTTVTFSRTGPVLNISGGRGNENNVMLDGAQLRGAIYESPQNLPSPDTMSEFRVLTNTYNAEYGRASGGVILAATKSGTNTFHGSIWEFLRNDALNARNFFAADKPILRQNQFGASISGPVILPRFGSGGPLFYSGRDRTFFFFNYQGIRIRRQDLITSFPPTARERVGDFSESPDPIIDPLTNQPFPGNVIPPHRIDPMAKSFIAKYLELPNRPDGRLVSAGSRPTDGNQFTFKVDHQLTRNDRLSVRYYQNRDEQGGFFASNVERLAGEAYNSVRTITISENHTFGPNLLNEFRASYTRVHSEFVASPLNVMPRELGGNINQDGVVPQVPWILVVGRFQSFHSFPLDEPDQNYQIDEKLTWLRGRHSLTAGAYYLHRLHLVRAEFWTSGFTVFVPAFTGNAMADFLLGQPVVFQQNSTLEDDMLANEYAFFVQDDFKIRPNLTLNLGLRYEFNPPWYHRYDRVSNILFSNRVSTTFPNAPPGLVVPGDPGVPRGLRPSDKNNFAPRVGLAWDPKGDGKTSVRAGYGVFYVIGPGAVIQDFMHEAPPWTLPLSFFPHSFSDPYFGRTDPFPYRVNLGSEVDFPPERFPIQGFSVNPNFRDGYIQQFNLNVQRQLGKNIFAQVGYVGRVGRKLYALREGNQAIFRPGATDADAQERRRFFPQFYGSIATLNSDTNSSYNSLQVFLDKRFANGYTFQVAYTFSKSIDEASAFQFDSQNGVQDPNNISAERGLSDYDQRHILSVNGIWEVPFLKGRGALTALLGGWQITGTTRIASGTPYTVLTGFDRALVGPSFYGNQTPQRPNVIGQPDLSSDRPRSEIVTRYFNTSAFALPPEGQIGNLGRNALIGPGFSRTDLALMKQFYLKELGRIQFRAEVFNLFNQVNFDNPDATFISPAFGQIVSAKDARIVQFGLRFDF